jgi:hypothetical protein
MFGLAPTEDVEGEGEALSEGPGSAGVGDVGELGDIDYVVDAVDLVRKNQHVHATNVHPTEHQCRPSDAVNREIFDQSDQSDNFFPESRKLPNPSRFEHLTFFMSRAGSIHLKLSPACRLTTRRRS